MKNKLNSSIYNLKRSAIRTFAALAKETPGCISLTLGEPDFDTPMNIRNAAIESLRKGETHYIANNGARNLLEEICCFEKEKKGISYSADEIIVTSGATEGLYTALFGIINLGDEVIVPVPAFGLYESIITMCGGRFVSMDTSIDDFQIRKENLANLITPKTKAIILNSPNNPTGVILDEESLTAIYEVVAKQKIFVICDDVYDQLVYTDSYKSFTSFKELKENIIVIQSFSKPYAMTGWRMGYLMADKAIKEHLELVHQYTVVSTCSFSQEASIEALKTDVSDMVETYRKRREYVLMRLEKMNLRAITPMGGFYVFPSIEEFGMTSGDFSKKMIETVGLAVTPGFCFGSDKHIRLTYCYSDNELEEGLNRLEIFINMLRENNE